MTNYGYLIKKNEYSLEELDNIRTDLTVQPLLNNKYNIVKEEPFPIYQEGQVKILLPKFYGLEKFGQPNEIKMIKNENDKISIKFSGVLRDYQIKVIDECKKFFFDKDNNLLEYGGGIISVPPGKGKTFMALYMAHLIGYKTLIIVHKTFLVNQWLERINEYIPNARIGYIQQDNIDIKDKDIVIGMLQSISMKEYDDDIFEGFPLVIFDEVHHLGAKVFSKALLKIQAPYTIGLSATPERKDKLEKVFYWHLGPIIYFQAADIDSTVNIKLYNFNLSQPSKLFKPLYNFITKQLNMAKMVSNLVELNQRNTFIINLIIREIFPIIPLDLVNSNILSNLKPINNKQIKVKKPLFDHLEFIPLTKPTYRKLLVLSNRIEHLKTIEKLLINYDNRWKDLIGYYIGGMKEHKLKESESKPLILATFEMASEGLDIKDLDTLLLATPKSSITQSIGRILRIQADKRKYIPIVYDIVDNISVFISQGKKRLSDYVSKEYKIEWYNVVDSSYELTNEPFIQHTSINNNIDQFIDE
jgi:superfamily II DNA or RNA helicase